MNLSRFKTVLAIAACALLGAASAHADATVPFAGRASGAVTNFVPGPGGVAITVVAQGNATHLGLISREEHILLDPVTSTFTGTIVFTAANGDQLSGLLSGGFVSQTSATGSYLFTGGTGRFVDTTGDADFVLSTPDGVHFNVTFEGKLHK